MKHDIVYAGKKKISTTTIIAIVVPIVALVLVFLSFCFLTMRARKKSNAIKGENFKKSDQILNYQGTYASGLMFTSYVTVFSFSYPREGIDSLNWFLKPNARTDCNLSENDRTY